MRRLPLESRHPLYRIPGLGFTRLILAGVLTWLFRLLNAAGLAGILFGPAESFFARFRDYALALPNGIRGLRHYLHGGRHVDQLARTVEYVNEHAPSPEEVRALAAAATSWTRRLEIGKGAIEEGLAELRQGEIVLGVSDVRSGLENLPPAGELQQIVDAVQRISEPALELLREVDLDPLFTLLLNAADNLSGDEIVSTLSAMVLLGTTIGLLTGYLATLWVRRGVPGLATRLWWKAGMRTHRRWYEERTPELIRSLGLDGEETIGGPSEQRSSS